MWCGNQGVTDLHKDVEGNQVVAMTTSTAGAARSGEAVFQTDGTWSLGVSLACQISGDNEHL